MDRRHRVEELFHEALALESSARGPFLAEACSGEPELLYEVSSLISAYEQPGSFIDTPAYQVSGLVDDDDDLSESIVGTSIGRYKVVRLIKRSGMGEVYLARDTHLPRDVALKLLPLAFTGDVNRLGRFTLEAEAASSLNHPNILTIHEIGHVEGVHYIATEFVDGQTVRERLSDGPLSLSEAVEIAIGVTNALVASHAAGIVHRDIKPENIMIRHDGYIKVLDFGLAKLTERADIKVDSRNAAMSMMDTDPGMLMGTIGYLSPEQANAHEVDTRSDLFSLGVVLYEMIAGQNPFNRGAFGEVIEAILRTEPASLAVVAPKAPASLQKIVSKALAKDKVNRYQHAEDLLADLKAVQAELRQRSMPRKLTPRERWWRIGIGVLAVVAIAFLGVAVLKILNRTRRANAVGNLSARLRFNVIQNWKSERDETQIEARFSHDGQMIAFMMLRDQWEGIWIKQAVSGAEPKLITTDPANNLWPVWSPDDQRIAFVSIREDKTGIWTTSVNGGPAQLLGNVKGDFVRTKSWSKDGRTIYYEAGNNLFGLDVATGAVSQLTKLENQSSYRNFRVSPDEDRLCYIDVQNGQTDIWVAGLHGEAPFKVTNDSEEDRTPLWHPDGKRIVYTSNRGGVFQICVGELDGSNPSQVTSGAEDHELSDISKDGVKLLDVSSRDNAEIFAVDSRSGQELELTSGSGLMLWPEVSRDGQMITFQAANSVGKIPTNSTILVKRTTSGGPLTQIAVDGFGPRWSPDGSRVAFLRFVDGKYELFTASSSGGLEQRLTMAGAEMNGFYLLPAAKFGGNFCWSQNGDGIVYSSKSSGVADLWFVETDGSSPKPLSANADAKLYVYDPLCGPNNEIAFAGESLGDAAGSWSVWLKDGDTSKLIFETNHVVRPLGWMIAGDELLVAAMNGKGDIGYPNEVKLLRVSVDGLSHPVKTLESAYFWSVQLAPDGSTVAYVSDQDKADNIWVMDIKAAGVRKLTANNEPRVFFAGLNWSSDGKTIYFGKQSSAGLISTIDNFE
jgi:Tol biopolymer transport system component